LPSEFLRRHKAGLLLFGCLLFSLICLTNQVDPTVNGFKSLVWYLISPEVVYSAKFFNKLDALRGRLFQLARAEGENHILRQQNIRLAKRELERDALQEENNRLRTLLDLKRMEFPRAIPAEVIAHDVRDWFYSVVIDKGRQDQLQISEAVVARAGRRLTLVGRVVEVEKSTSKVLLITDPLSAVSVSLESSGDLGLLEGRNKPTVLVKYLSNRSKVRVGDEVKTVGLGGVFPPGVPVGIVTQAYETSDGFFKEAVVEPYLDFRSLQEVLVLERREIRVVGTEP